MTASLPNSRLDLRSPSALLSIVVPVYNEREVLPLFYGRILAVMQALSQRYELVLVDDGSQDGSAEWMHDLCQREPHIRIVSLSRNFGKEAAVTAGLEHARGDAVILLDADLQDPPELIPQMVGAWLEGADVVSMRRRSRTGETWFKQASARWFYRFLNRVSRFEIPEDTGDFRLMSRRALNALLQLPERNRYMKGLFAWIGMPTQVLFYDRDPRKAGTTKWNVLGLFGLAFEGITSFSTAPLRWVTALGGLAAIWGSCFGIWIVSKAIVLGDPVPGYPSLVALITFLGGVQLLTVGLVGEYVGKTYIEVKQRPIYLLRDVVQSPLSTELTRNQQVLDHAESL